MIQNHESRPGEWAAIAEKIPNDHFSKIECTSNLGDVR